jgi:pimeloyl-ACP methyl ester carboxylesterase
MLVVHGAGGPQSVSGFSEALAEHAHVLVPTHPGFAGEPRPEWFNSVDDLALTYLDLIERLDLREVIVIGFSFGGWIVAEIANVFSRPPDELPALSNRPPAAASAISNLGQDAARAANFQALAVYSREHGLRDPKLRRRLARVKIPALLIWGENDRIVDPDYGRAYAHSLPKARFTLIPEAGHFPQIEQPERLLTIVKEFVDSIES